MPKIDSNQKAKTQVPTNESARFLENRRSLLTTTLQLAVPLWIERLRHAGWDHVQERARTCSQIVAEKGDIIQFKSKKPGESAAAFNALAEGIACLAFCPGGVTVFGDHWEACQSDDQPSRSRDQLTKLLNVILKGLEGVK